jgi:uncharacterized protein
MTADPRVLADGIAANLLHLIVMPTEACNFRCTYCYEDFEHGAMPEPVVEGLLRLLEHRAPGLDRLELSWFGGEPLAAHRTVVRIMEHVGNLAQVHSDLDVHSDMTTNGYLLDRPLFERLCRVGVTRYQISFDGPPGIHDRKRIQANGKPSFERIWGNLLSAAETDLEFRIMVRLHVDRENARACEAFLDHMRRDLGGDPRFPLFLRLLSRWGGSNDEALAVYDEGSGKRVLDRLRDSARTRGIPIHEPPETGHVCYAARANSFVIRADGTVGKCTLALRSDHNRVGRLDEEGRMNLSEWAMAPWMRGLFTGDAGALRCPNRDLSPEATNEPPPVPAAGCEAEVETVTGEPAV